MHPTSLAHYHCRTGWRLHPPFLRSVGWNPADPFSKACIWSAFGRSKLQPGFSCDITGRHYKLAVSLILSELDKCFLKKRIRGISSCTVVQCQLHWSALVDDSLQGMLAQKPFPQWVVGEDGGKIEKGNNDVVEANTAKDNLIPAFSF